MIKLLCSLVILIMVGICSNAYSFNVDGFKSGMTKKEIKNKVDRMNFAKIIERNIQGDEHSWGLG